jgi:probable HAF family extracellular repeat protein
MRPSRQWKLIPAALAGLLGLTAPAAAQVYTLTNIPPISGATGTSAAFGISPDGHYVTGFSSVAGGQMHAFRWDTTTPATLPVDLGVLAGTAGSVGLGVNTAGTVVGYSTNGTITSTFRPVDTSDQAFLRGLAAASPTAIPVLAGGGFSGGGYTSNRAQGVSSGTNEISGYAFNLTTGDFQGFRANPTGTTQAALANLAGTFGTFGAGTLNLTYGINASGGIAGEADRDNGANPNPYFAVLYPAGITAATQLPLPAGFTNAHGLAVNDGNHVAGLTNNCPDTAASNPATPIRGYFYNGTTATALGTLLTGDQSIALGLNNSDVAVGHSNLSPGPGATHAVRFNTTTGTATDLSSSAVVSNLTTWVLQSAEAIDSNGDIVGYGIAPNGSIHGFLLTPVPEPGTLALAGLGLGGLALRGWRRRAAAVVT